MAELKPGWQRVRFGDVVRLNKETCKDPAAEGIERVIGLEHLEPSDLRIRSWGHVADGTTFTNRVRPGQVLFGKRRAYQRKIAVADCDAVCSGDIYVFKSADPKRLLPELLPFICQTQAFFEHAVSTSAGSLSPRTNWKSLAEYKFALPPLEEQQRLVKVLASSNTAVCVYDTAAESSIAVIASELDDHFLRGIDKFRAAKLGEVADIRHGYAFPGSDFVDFESGLSQGLPVLVTPKNFTEHGELDFSPNRTKYFKGAYPSSFMLAEGELTVLMTDLTPSAKLLGAPALINRAALQNQRIGLVRLTEPTQTRLRYLFYMLCCGQVRRQIRSTATGTTVRHTSPKSIKGCSLPLPPLAEQDLLVHRWDDLTKARSTISERGRELRKMHYAIINALLGKPE